MGATSAVDDGLVAELVARTQAGGVKLMTKRVLQSALEGELTDHLGHEPGERAEGGRVGHAARASPSKPAGSRTSVSLLPATYGRSHP
jgi:transposase-like protein